MTTLAQPPTQSADDVTQIYERQIRSQVEAATNRGRFVAFDPGTASYEIGESGVDAARRLRNRQPGAQPVVMRIGYDLTIDPRGRPRYVER